MHCLRFAAFPVVLFVTLPAVNAQSVAAYGSGCGGRQTELRGYGSPTPGGTIELRANRAAPAALHLLILGFSNSQWSGGNLPFAPGPGLGFAPGCLLLASPDLVSGFVVGPEGTGAHTFGLPTGPIAGSAYCQLIGLPIGEPSYGTNGIELAFGPATPVAVSGVVRDRTTMAPVGNARVTVFTPGLTTFAETRSNAGGGYALAVRPGRYRAGMAALDREYVELDLDVGPAPALWSPLLDPETQPGSWNVIGNTLPEVFDATDVAILLRDGRILYCHDTSDPVVFDPVTGQKSFPSGSGTEQGCMNLTLLEDGAVIMVGGQEGASPGSFTNATRWVKRWLPGQGWAFLMDLLQPNGRWYPGLARLANGNLLVMGGGTRPSAVRTNTCEIFDQASQTWQFTGAMGQAVEFPPSALLYTGRVLRTWGSPELYDPATGTWGPTGAFTAANRGWPGHSDHSLCVLHDGSVIVVGINTSTAGLGAPMVERYDPITGTWTARSSPSLKRAQAEVIALPDGRVLVAGGDRLAQVTTEPSLYGCVRRCDLYAPDSDSWRRIADLVHFREYHAVTVLVADGRVVTTGGTRIKFQNTPISADIEAWSPPYLFRGVRPAITNLSTTAPQRGATVAFDVVPATALTSVVLLGTGAHTHWVEGGVPRRLVLPVQQVGAQVSVVLPTDPNVLPIGHYLLFAMVDDIPSVGNIVRVRP